jgi:hypothetical protein
MNVGDVVYTKSINILFDTEAARGTMGFKAPKGKRLVFLALGVDSAEDPLDVKQALNALGYVPDPELVKQVKQ